jgi:hypothetical protein
MGDVTFTPGFNTVGGKSQCKKVPLENLTYAHTVCANVYQYVHILVLLIRNII